jgi:hypothetical protein
VSHNDFVLAKVDCVENEELYNKFAIEGYPTIKLFSKGKHIDDYNGFRTTEAIVEYAERTVSAPLFLEFSDANTKWLFEERPGYRNHILLLNGDDASRAAMDEVSKRFPGQAVFAHVPATDVNSNIYEQFNVEVGGSPFIKAIKSSRANNEMRFYELDKDVSVAKSIADFVAGVLDGSVKADVKKVDPLPEEEEL